MKIWSLLPSATEMLFAVGAGDQVTGVTHECDFPGDATSRPRVTFSNIDSSQPSSEIDRQVTEHFQSGRRLYGIDEDRLRTDPPDLVVTQDLCPVCAVSPSDFAGHLTSAGCAAEMLTLNPNTLEDVFDDITRVGEATGRAAEAHVYVDSLRRRVTEIEQAVAGEPRRRVLCVEWLDPPMPGGHWVPEMVRIAGGVGGPHPARAAFLQNGVGSDAGRRPRSHRSHALWIRTRTRRHRGRATVGGGVVARSTRRASQ
jgi:iron complex transport system substrate-binding protein